LIFELNKVEFELMFELCHYVGARYENTYRQPCWL